ncbi:MAG: DHH family phosphoesterase, partial [Candidatus ainarchaeum sp.]|nr:DHH family phosphoesterase [Candidatus ainarchaeum sp.]
MSIETFNSFLKKYKDKKLVITTHRHPDVDGIASMYALGQFLENSIYALQDNPSEDTHPLIEKLGMEFQFLRDLKKEDYDGLIVFDCHSYVLVTDAKGWNLVLIIDHHQDESKNMHAEFEIIRNDSPSNVEVIYELLPKIDKKTAYALAVGIISDTARFKSAKASTFEKLSRLIELSGVSYKELFDCAYPQEPMDKRMAVLTALQRVETIEYKG